MTYAQALVRLEAMTAAQSAPLLTTDELAVLLEQNQVVDATGLAPTAAGYVPTWDLNRAACEGWRWKAGKCAGLFDFTADGATFNRAQMLDHCEKMIAQYARKVMGSVPVQAPIATSYPIEDAD